MKKKLLTLIICLVMIICTACTCTKQTSAIESVTQVYESMSLIETIDMENNIIYILVDNDTKVMYMLVIAHRYSSSVGIPTITPLYNADGTLKIYEN